VVITLNSDCYKTILVKDFPIIPIEELQKTELIRYQEFEFKQPKTHSPLLASNYNELKNLSFSMLYPYYANDSTKGDTYQLQALFSDPIMFNILSIGINKTYDTKSAGFTYINERYIPFELSWYDVNSDLKTPKERGYFAKAKLFGPLFRNDRERLDGALEIYQDEDNKQKEPTLLSLQYAYDEHYTQASNSYLSYSSQVVARKDREASTKGLEGKFNSHIFGETYLDLNGKWMENTHYIPREDHGVLIVDTIFDKSKDATNVLIEGVDNNFYVKKLTSAGVGVRTTFYFNKYFPIFPISIRKEQLFASWNQYNVETRKEFTIDEKIVGTELDLLFFHKFSLPLTVKYIQNDSSKNNYKIAISIGTEF